jgi:hypothetical protein
MTNKSIRDYINLIENAQKGLSEGWDPDTTRLEQDVRDALENGDDYTAKQYAKMAPTPEAKKYLLNIIKQAMYIDDLGGETDWKGVAESWTKLPSGDYQNSHTGVRTNKPPQKKKRGEKTWAEWDAIEKAKQDKQQGGAEGSDELYQKAIRKYTQRVANDYLGGGNAHLYGAGNFDSEMFGVDPKQAEQDFDRLFPQYLKKLQGGKQLEETTPDAIAKIEQLTRK